LLDNLSTGTMDNLSWAVPGMDLDFIETDLHNQSALKKLLQSCSQVIHLAAVTSVPITVAEPHQTHINNVDSTLNLLEAARSAGVERFIFASSAAVYGDCEKSLQTEGTPANPLSPYAVHKLTCEYYVRLFSNLYGLPGICLRLFNVYGPRQPRDELKSGVISQFCRQMLRGQAPTIHGDGQQTRDFIHISDIVEAFVRCLDAPMQTGAGMSFNIASGCSYSLLEAVECINSITSQNLKPEFFPSRAGDILRSKASIELAASTFGFKPRVNLDDGLRNTLDYEKSISAEPASITAESIGTANAP